MSNLFKSIHEYIDAAFPGIYVQSSEPDDAVNELIGLCTTQGWAFATWDISKGLQPFGKPIGDDSPDPVAAVRSLKTLAQADPSKAGLLILRNFHRFLDGVEVVQALEVALAEGKQNRTFVVILAPEVKLPLELQKLFVIVEHQLPDRAEMEKVLKGIATEERDLPSGGVEHILDAAAGLTRIEAEGAFSLSLIRHGKIRPETLWEIKSAALKKSGLLSLHRGGETFAGLGGLENLKAFCKRSLTHRRRTDLARPRGVMLLGVPGTGKSAFAKALGNEVERPTITLDVGALMGSLVGETESNTRRALEIIDAMAPCIVFVDEIEKGLAGTTGGGDNDSGVGGRLLGSFLTWLQDHTSDVFFIATSNDVTKLPPAFTRAERFDGIFFIDLATDAQKKIIWDIYVKMFELDNQKRPADKDWTGAEIRSCCRLAAMLGITLLEAAQNVVPVATTAGESVDSLRRWASGRCLSSEKAGFYHHDLDLVTEGAPKATRNIRRSDN